MQYKIDNSIIEFERIGINALNKYEITMFLNRDFGIQEFVCITEFRVGGTDKRNDIIKKFAEAFEGSCILWVIKPAAVPGNEVNTLVNHVIASTLGFVDLADYYNDSDHCCFNMLQTKYSHTGMELSFKIRAMISGMMFRDIANNVELKNIFLKAAGVTEADMDVAFGKVSSFGGN